MLRYTNNTKLICVSYQDEFSAGNISINDLNISFENKIFAAGAKRLSKFEKDDFVIICANENKKRKCFLARISSKVPTIQTWHEQGGQLWNYNFEIDILTGITDITPNGHTKNLMENIFRNLGLNINNLFNSRFCSEKLMDGLANIYNNKLFCDLNANL